MALIINKFGGGIMNGSDAIKHLPEIFKSYGTGDYSVNVFSAFGKTTNNLEKVLRSYVNGETAESNEVFSELKVFHMGIARELFPEDHAVFGMIEDIFKKIRHILSITRQNENIKYIYDQVVPYGEILASLIVSEYLSYIGVPNILVHATNFLKTDSSFNTANVDKETTSKNLKVQMREEILALYKNIITEGFIGFSEEGMTTLGREGSDYTAGLLGNLMEASKVTLWKDVPGVMEKNPRLAGNENVQKIDVISYDDFGKHLQSGAAGLVHPKTLNEVREKKIPLHIKPFWDLSTEGTLIN
ncbi:MAG: hypothetical protein M3M85_04295 [bacterium]|nr:hypothetical protein [bacterium]